MSRGEARLPLVQAGAAGAPVRGGVVDELVEPAAPRVQRGGVGGGGRREESGGVEEDGVVLGHELADGGMKRRTGELELGGRLGTKATDRAARGSEA
ncbi:hypothetical protein AB1Y20_019133 [Prymnesium parvum]|uniref:Uncharacterized protein n=1 Tax=Prymnesium parvum TaxID=97485 RepID=A0AB34JQJ6_PRYPA